MEDDPLANMQARANLCRRLADFVHDRSMSEQLHQWAEDIEADIRRLRDRIERDDQS